MFGVNYSLESILDLKKMSWGRKERFNILFSIFSFLLPRSPIEIYNGYVCQYKIKFT
jgi:ATP-dependent helicase/DNAse subunit B